MTQEEYDNQRRAIIHKGIESGLTYREIGKELGVSRTGAYYLLKVLHIQEKPQRKKYGPRDPSTYYRGPNPRPRLYENDPRIRWLRKILGSKQISKKDRLTIFMELKDNLPATCPIFAIELKYFGGHNPNAASLDKLDPLLGYTPGNVSVISMRANRLKNNGTAEEHHKIAVWMEEQMRLLSNS